MISISKLHNTEPCYCHFLYTKRSLFLCVYEWKNIQPHLSKRRRGQEWENERKAKKGKKGMSDEQKQRRKKEKYFQLTESISEHHLTYPFFFSSKTKGWKTRPLSLGKMCQKQNCVEIHPCQTHHVFPFYFSLPFPSTSLHFTFTFTQSIFHHPSSSSFFLFSPIFLFHSTFTEGVAHIGAMFFFSPLSHSLTLYFFPKKYIHRLSFLCPYTSYIYTRHDQACYITFASFPSHSCRKRERKNIYVYTRKGKPKAQQHSYFQSGKKLIFFSAFVVVHYL